MSTGVTVPDAAAEASRADAHFEGDQFLWFGPEQGMWFDASLGKVRAMFRA